MPNLQEAGCARGLAWTGAANLAPPPPGFDPLTVQSVAGYYTDRTIPARQVKRRVEYVQVLIKYDFFQPKSWMAKKK